VAINRQGILGRGGYEGMQLDSDGNIWIVEDIGAPGANTFSGAKQANSFVYRFIPTNVSNLGEAGRLQVLQAAGLDGNPVTFGTPAASLADVNTTFMHDLHTYGNSFDTRWITIHDTATDGTAAFNANALAKSLGGTPFKRPENGQFRPGSKFGEFYFTETGDTSAMSAANASYGGWGGVLKLDHNDPSATTGHLSPFYVGDLAHTGLDNIAFLDKDNILVVEDAGDGLHSARGLDSGYILPIERKGGIPTPFRFLAEGRDPSATLDAANAGFGRNKTDNEITGIHLSDGDASIKGLIGTKEPQFLNADGKAHEGWRLFWTQLHGDNATFEVLNAPR
jgi:secreted PhoX family phosphatase